MIPQKGGPEWEERISFKVLPLLCGCCSQQQCREQCTERTSVKPRVLSGAHRDGHHGTFTAFYCGLTDILNNKSFEFCRERQGLPLCHSPCPCWLPGEEYSRHSLQGENQASKIPSPNPSYPNNAEYCWVKMESYSQAADIKETSESSGCTQKAVTAFLFLDFMAYLFKPLRNICMLPFSGQTWKNNIEVNARASSTSC